MAHPSHACLGSATCTTSRCLGINPEIRVTRCGQLSLVATYAQAEDVDSRSVPVEHPRVDRYPRSGEVDDSYLDKASPMLTAGQFTVTLQGHEMRPLTALFASAPAVTRVTLGLTSARQRCPGHAAGDCLAVLGRSRRPRCGWRHRAAAAGSCSPGRARSVHGERAAARGPRYDHRVV